MILHVSMSCAKAIGSGKILSMSHAYPEPAEIPRKPAQFRTDPDSEEWRDSKYTYSEDEIAAVNGHYGWEAFRIRPEELSS